MKHDRTIALLEKTRANGRQRSKDHRAREREAKQQKRWFDHEPDKEVSRYVKLRRSEIAKAVAEFDLQPDADQWLSLSELKQVDGKALAEALRWALKNKP